MVISLWSCSVLFYISFTPVLHSTHQVIENMSDITRIVARAIRNDENNNFKLVLIDIAKAFERRGFFQCENWREILNESFNPNDGSAIENENSFQKNENRRETQLTEPDVNMEATNKSTFNNQASEKFQQLKEMNTPTLLVKKSQSGEINEFVDSSVHSLPLSLLYSHTSTPISAVKAKSVRINEILANLRGANWRKIVLEANVKQSNIQFVTSSKDCNAQIESKKDSVKIVAKPIHVDVIVQNSSEIIETVADQKLNQNVLQAPVMPGATTDFPVVASCSTFNNVPENACDNSDEQNRISTFPRDENSDNDDDNLLIPLGTRTPSPIKLVSRNENIKNEMKLENEMDAAVESMKNNEVRRVHSLDWAQMCSKVTQGQAQSNAFTQRSDVRIMTILHSDLVVDDNMDHGSEPRVSKETKNNVRKRKLSKVVTDSAMSSAGTFRRKPNPSMEPISSANLDDIPVPQSKEPVLGDVIKTRRMTRLQSRIASGMHPTLPEVALKTVNTVVTNQRAKTRKNTQKVPKASTGRRVMFTLLKSEPFALLLEKLHITLATSNTDFDVLVTNRICRSNKFMIALGSGKPIVSIEWLNAMEKSNSWLDPLMYLLNDQSGEKKYQFSLPKTIKAASEEKLFKHCSILVTPNTMVDPEELKAVIVSSGGKYMKTTLRPRKGDRIICVSDIKDKKMWPRLLKKYPSLSDIIHVHGFARAIFDHSLDIKEYSLQN